MAENQDEHVWDERLMPRTLCKAGSTRPHVILYPEWENMLDRELMKSIATQMMESGKVQVEGKAVRLKRTSSQRLKTLTFEMDGREYQAIEQNPDKPSGWGQLARAGHKVVQFRDVETGKYVAVAVGR